MRHTNSDAQLNASPQPATEMVQIPIPMPIRRKAE
jgi:hypothetical protein